MKICPLCEGYTDSELSHCATCAVPLVLVSELAWPERGDEGSLSNPWLGVVVGGKYRITGTLGKGGMGTVYRSVHEVSLAHVALKILHPRFARKEEYKKALVEEAQKASRIRSEHVARILDVGETPDGSVFAAMELVDGETLFEVLEREGSLPVPLVIEILTQLCSALETAHAAGVIHRDLAPRNVILERGSSRPRAKVLDFGIAVRAGDELVGTELWINPPYTAPEILSGALGDPRSDLFSVGVLAFEMLTGELPFGGGALKQRVRSVQEDAPRRVSWPAQCPSRLKRLVLRLLEKDAESRPERAALVLDELSVFRRAPSRLLRVATLVIFLVAAFLAANRLFQRPIPFLRSAVEGRFSLREGPVRVPTAYRAEELARVTLPAGGFAPGELWIELRRGEQVPIRAALDAPVKAGRIVLDKERDSTWRRVVDYAGRADGPVSLHFSARSRGFDLPLGQASILVDLGPPEFAAFHVNSGDVLRQDSTLDLRFKDDRGVGIVQFELRGKSGNVLHAFERRPRKADSLQIPIGQILTEEGLGRRLGVRLLCRLVDVSGRSTEYLQDFDEADFFIPKLLRAGAPRGGNVLEVSAGSCDVLLEISRDSEGEELRLRAYAQPPKRSAEVEFALTAVPGQPRSFLRYRMEAPSFAAEEAIPFRFVLEDAVGNASELRCSLAFRNLDIGGRFAGIDPSRPAIFVAPNELLVGARGCRVRYSCNSAFIPRLDPSTLQALPGKRPVRVRTEKEGLLEFDILASPEAELSFRVRIKHFLVSEGPGQESFEREVESQAELEVALIPKGPVLNVRPALLSGQAWLPELLQSEVLQKVGNGRFSIGPLLDPELSPAAHATCALWGRREGRWARLGGAAADRLAVLRKRSFELQRGSNALALEIRDGLGRSLVGREPSGAARPSLDVSGHRLVPFAQFRYDPTPPVPSGEVLVEFGERVQIRLREDVDLSTDKPVWLEAPDTSRGSDSRRGSVHRGPDGTECLFRIPFRVVARWCRWEGVAASEFASRGVEELGVRFRSEAGEAPLRLTFRPVKSLLRAVKIDSLTKEQVPDALRMDFVPFLGQAKGQELVLGVPESYSAKGSLALSTPLRVTELGDFVLSSGEVSREAWLAFMKDVLRHRITDGLVRELGHAEDPLAEARFTEDGLRPRVDLFASSGFEACVRAGPKRPVTGVNYYQAAAFARWYGKRFLNDPDAFRLPFGAELEWAAVAARPRSEGRLVLGALDRAGKSPSELRSAFLRFSRAAGKAGKLRPDLWPASPSESRAIGDLSYGLGAAAVLGLDFGVREWVEDLPIFESGPASEVFRSRSKSLAAQISFARLRRKKPGGDLGRSFHRWLSLGVVRGMAFGEPSLNGEDPTRLILASERGQTASLGRILGVKRSIQLPRSGSGLAASGPDPLLGVCGFRLAGSRTFLRRMRESLR